MAPTTAQPAASAPKEQPNHSYWHVRVSYWVAQSTAALVSQHQTQHNRLLMLQQADAACNARMLLYNITPVVDHNEAGICQGNLVPSNPSIHLECTTKKQQNVCTQAGEPMCLQLHCAQNTSCTGASSMCQEVHLVEGS
jgi:hypothetical protein